MSEMNLEKMSLPKVKDFVLTSLQTIFADSNIYSIEVNSHPILSVEGKPGRYGTKIEINILFDPTVKKEE